MRGWFDSVCSSSGLEAAAPAIREPVEAERCCSFCGQAETLAGPLFGGEAAYICEACLDACNRVLEADQQRRQARILAALPSPQTLRRRLDAYVVGQERAKKVLAVAVYNHYKRLLAAARGETVALAKSNVLLLGGSGTGKSYLAACLARSVDVPFVAVDATTLTAAGHAGDDADHILERLLSACGDDPERAARGIVYLDELDKLAARPGTGGTADIAGEGAQQALLQLLEGCQVTVHRLGGCTMRVDTRQILFIAGGAFEGLDAAGAEAPGIGFTAALGAGASTEVDRGAALQRYGLLPELIGRLPVVAELEALSTAALKRILTEPRNALVRQYRALLGRDGCELTVTDEALTAIAERAWARGTGARGLRAEFEALLLEPMFTIPAAGGRVARLTIDAEAVRTGTPLYEFHDEARAAG